MVQALIDKEVQKGHMLGPFDEPPLEGMYYSPINLVEKAGGKEDEYRLIHDLASPYDGVSSVNACIPPENSKVCYHHIIEVIRRALRIGKNATGVHADVRHAFRNLPLRLDQLRFMAFTLNGKIYINSSLPFGAASSCLIFERVATLLEWIVKNETGRDFLSHYLDDFPLLGHSLDDAQEFLDQFVGIMQDIGMPIADDKTISPTQFLIYLGLILNFLDQVIEVPKKKQKKCMKFLDEMINAYHSHKMVLIESIQSLAGHLNFVCQAIPAGKTFLSSIYALLVPIKKEVVRPGHHQRLNKEMHDNLVMFHSFFDALAPQHHHSVPFLQQIGVRNHMIQFHADLAGSSFLGFGCVFKRKYGCKECGCKRTCLQPILDQTSLYWNFLP